MKIKTWFTNSITITVNSVKYFYITLKPNNRKLRNLSHTSLLLNMLMFCPTNKYCFSCFELYQDSRKILDLTSCLWHETKLNVLNLNWGQVFRCTNSISINKKTNDSSKQPLSKQQARFHLYWECQAPKYANKKGVKAAADLGSTCSETGA